ncbi:MAG: hypothetical protein JNL08_00695 [Planctomycetes bacterium]|nr:hypothetical protein [Planctomycetota bacterium]
MNLCSVLFAAAAALAPLAAQTAATTSPPHILVDTVGPDGWRIRFAPTNLGSLLESEQGRALWQPGTAPVLGWLRQGFGADTDFGPVQDRLLGYGGRIRVGVWLRQDESREPRPFAAAAVFEGDGRTDLGALAADLRQMQSGLDGDWGPQEFAGRSVTMLCHGEDRMTAPIVGEHHLLIVTSTGDDIAAALANATAWVGTCDGKAPAPTTPALRIQVATPELIALMRRAAGDDDEAATLQALGIDGLGPSLFQLSTAGPHVQCELAQAFAEAPRGLFAALFPGTTGVPALQRLLPSAPGSWKVGRFDLLALYDAAVAVAAANGIDEPEMRQDMREQLGVDLRDDLLAHVTDAMLLHGASFEDIDRLERTPWLLAFGLRDHAAFATSLETALAKAKPMLQREATVEHGNAKLWRYGNMFAYDLWLGVGDGLFVVAGGEDGEDRVKALFDAARAPAAAEAPALPPAIADLQRHLPPGLNGAAAGDLDSLAALPADLWWSLLREFVPVPRPQSTADTEQQREALRELLRQHHLDRLRSATGFAERTWRWRLYW